MAFKKGDKKVAGSGRKKGSCNVRTHVLREAWRELVTPEKAKSLLETAIQQARNGDSKLLTAFLPYVEQEIPKSVEHEVSGAEKGPIAFCLKLDNT